MKISDASVVDPSRMGQAYGTRAETQGVGKVAGVLVDSGQLLKGRVVSVDPSGVLTVETEAGTFRATAASALPVGREFLFQVVQGGENPLLAEAGKANAVLNLLRVMLPGMFGVGGVGLQLTQEEAVRAFWNGQAMDGQPDPVKLAKTIAQFSQSQPHDGKSFLPIIAGPGGPETPAAQSVSRLIEAHAMVNQQGGATTRCDYVIFPVFFAEQAGKGEWLFSFDRQEGGEDGAGGEVTTLSFYLAMSRLGDLHIALTTRPQSVSGVITLATEEAADHVRQHLHPLVQALERLTDAATTITCRCGPVDCLKALKEDLTSKLGLVDHYALVDLRA